jgi:hypothetical protein
MVFVRPKMYTAGVRSFALLLSAACLLAQIPAELRLVSVADRAQLYETENAGELSFTLHNQMDLELEGYSIEVWTRGPLGRPVRSCAIGDPHTAIGREPQLLKQHCDLPVDVRTGKTVEHTSRLVELDWEHDVHWRPDMPGAAHPRS